MMSPKKVTVLKEINKSIDTVLQKIDKENEKFLSVYNLNVKQKKIMLKAMDEFEKNIQAFFIGQKKGYLEIIKKVPEEIKGRKIKKRIRKANIPEDMLDNITDIIAEFIFANEKQHIDRLEALYTTFANSFFSEIAEICARAVEGNKFSPDTRLSETADKWLKNHTIKFAQEVNQTTHDAVIKVIRDSLKSGNGNTSAANEMVSTLPSFFNQNKIKAKSNKLSDIVNVDIYNQIYQSLEKQKCFEFYRARRITRTETNSSLNASTLEGWRQSEVIDKKEWLCAFNNSRDAHMSANGQQVGLDEPFIVNGEKLMHPGDSSCGASAENVIQCKCTMKSVLRYKRNT